MQRLKFIIFAYYHWMNTLQFCTHFHKKIVSFMLVLICQCTTFEIKVEIAAKNENRLKILCNSL